MSTAVTEPSQNSLRVCVWRWCRNLIIVDKKNCCGHRLNCNDKKSMMAPALMNEWTDETKERERERERESTPDGWLLEKDHQVMSKHKGSTVVATVCDKAGRHHCLCLLMVSCCCILAYSYSYSSSYSCCVLYV